MAWKKKILEKIDKGISNFIVKMMDIHKEFRKYRFFEYFEQREDDIYIITFFKSGTTWMQMILYQMLSKDGSVDFDHIYDVSPWATNEAMLNGDATRINSLPSPRVIKTHEPYDQFDPSFKGKFVFVYRDGRDVAVSLYHHRKNYNNPSETLEESFKNYFSPEEEYNWFTFNDIWMRNANNFDILYVNYANLKLHFDEEIER
ncbi:MAG: sulfotransferase domain-containing protein, partial [Chitinophagales bacterium]